MPFDVVNIGSVANDGTGDSLRDGGTKINNNFALAVEGPATATDSAVAVFDGTTGKLIKQSTFLESSLTPLYPNSTTGGLFLAAPGNIQTISHLDGRLMGLVLRVSNTINIDRIVANVVTAGSAGAVIRLGIYRVKNDGSGFTLIVDAGTIDATTAGIKDIVISETLTPGAYFVGAASQGGALTAPVMRTKGEIDGFVVTNAASNHLTNVTGYVFLNVTGALPATLPYGDMVFNANIFVPLRIAV